MKRLRVEGISRVLEPMDHDRWKAVNEIFYAALEIDSSQRKALVQSRANGDREVEAEVQRLLEADSDAKSFLETPASLRGGFDTAPSQITPGNLLCERFRVVRELGRGGMGQVFEAFDTELEVSVALKVIHADMANTELVARFRREIRLARTITHPNICRTFDLERDIRIVNGRPAETLFLTMEYLAGETLSSRIKRDGAIPLPETLAIARQIANALHAAHRCGVIHRDMKPGNIMLASDESPASPPRVVITDFGLAHVDPALSTGELSKLTQTGLPMGTLSYMAPEQLEGKTATPAVDIYAFGLILFEMIAGRRAFPEFNPLSSITERLRGVSLDHLLPAETPQNWRRTIQHCIAVDPADRPADAMQAIRTIETVPGRVTRKLPLRYLSFKWKAATIFVLSLVALALFWVALRLYPASGRLAVTPGAVVYLAPVKNQTGDRRFDDVTELISAGLSQSAQLNLLDRGTVGDILQQMTKSPETSIDDATAREIALRARAARVVFTTLTGSHGSYILEVDIQQPDGNNIASYRDHWHKSFAWHSPPEASSTVPAELLARVRSASDWIRNQVGESASDIASLDQAPQDVTTANWEALAEYTRAQSLAARGLDEAAATSLQNAIGFDPGFALAHARLGDILVAEERTKEGFAAYARALDVSNFRRLSRRERDRIKGMYAYDSGDIKEADAAFRDYTSFYENDPNGWAYRVGPLIDLGRTEEAIASLEHLLELRPQSDFGLYEMAGCLLLEGKYEAARQAIERVRLAGYTDRATKLEGGRLFLTGDFAAAENTFQELSNSHSVGLQRQRLPLLARVYADRGAYPRALRSIDEAVQAASPNADATHYAALLMDRAAIYARLGEEQAMLRDVQESLSRNSRGEKLAEAATLIANTFTAASATERPALIKAIEALQARIPPHGSDSSEELVTTRLHLDRCLVHSDWKGALAAAMRADTLDAPAGNKSYLGHAFAVIAAHQSDAATAARIDRYAMQAYANVALRPAVVWRQPLSALPGDYAGQLEEFVRLAATLTPSSPEAQQGAAALRRLRGQ